MRRSLSLLLAFILLFPLTACGADASPEEVSPPQETVQAALPEIPEPEPTYIPDRNAEYVVYDTETKKVSDGHGGHIVDVYLVTMDAKGLVVSREKKYTDTYKPLAPKIYVGVMPRETPVPPEYGLID